EGPASDRALQAIELDAGAHLVALRIVRGRGPGVARLALAPLDGSPAPVRFRAAAAGDRPGEAPDPIDDAGLRLAGNGAALAAALVEEAGVVGLHAAALEVGLRDVQAARALADRGIDVAPEATPLLALRAELVAADGTLPQNVAAARAARDRDRILA